MTQPSIRLLLATLLLHAFLLGDTLAASVPPDVESLSADDRNVFSFRVLVCPDDRSKPRTYRLIMLERGFDEISNSLFLQVLVPDPDSAGLRIEKSEPIAEAQDILTVYGVPRVVAPQGCGGALKLEGDYSRSEPYGFENGEWFLSIDGTAVYNFSRTSKGCTDRDLKPMRCPAP